MCGLLLFSLLWTCSNFVGADRERDADPSDNFIEDIITNWKFLSPTIIFTEEHTTDLCWRRDMTLCVTNDANSTELAGHLAMIHKDRKQDVLIFVGSPGHEQLLIELTKLVPSMFTSNCPVFMPRDYSTMIKLRLDSNIIFHEVVTGTGTEFDLVDIFAIKDGPPIKLEVGKWDVDSGIRLLNSISRWERRTDLKGASLVNSFWTNEGWSDFIKDNDGNIVGSRGYIQDLLFYITDSLNLTIKTIEYPQPSNLLENGSWTAGRGLLQRKEIDVMSQGSVISPSGRFACFGEFVECPIATMQLPTVLVASSPNGTALNVWAYVQVFGITHWIIFLAFLVSMVMGLSIISFFFEDDPGKTFGTKRGNQHQYQLSSLGSAIALVYLYLIQMGSHTSTKQNAIRVLTCVISMLTFIWYVFYTTDITANMTSGPSKIPVRNFEDVLHYGYSVIAASSYYRKFLGRSKNDSAGYKVHKKYMEGIDEIIGTTADNFKKVVMEPKTLMYGSPVAILNQEAKSYRDQLQILNTDDSHITYVTLKPSKDSEFTQIFNHYILKGHEHGIYKRLYKNHHIELFTSERFGMTEPQPLGASNVMFTFVLLGSGVVVSFLVAFAEFFGKKCITKKTSSSAWSATQRNDNERTAIAQ